MVRGTKYHKTSSRSKGTINGRSIIRFRIQLSENEMNTPSTSTFVKDNMPLPGTRRELVYGSSNIARINPIR